jgi:peptidoglycan-N-acetylglucosamine deacetylase
MILRSKSATVAFHSLFIAAILVATSALSTVQPSIAEERVTTFDTFDVDEPVVTLTFDVTFDRGGGADVLDTLAYYDIPATFAVTGVWAQGNPDLMQRIVAEGHHLMNHTWSHPSFTGEFTGSLNWEPTNPLTPEEMMEQLQRTEDLVREQVGVELQPYFRPPYGDYNEEVLRVMAEAGYTYNIMWTVDTLGWHERPVDEVVQRALDAAQPGANILLHIGHGSTDEEALPEIIEGFRELGYDFATVEDFVEGQLSQLLERHFPETGYAVEGDFLRYWDANGGQESFGYPISPELEEDGVKTQYFQRARFQSAEGPDLGNHNVLVTHSGSNVSRERVRDVPYRSVRGASSDYCGHPPTSRHSVCGGFQETREASDEQIVAVNPISPEYRERDPSTGETFIVQYVEHRRLTRSRRIGSRTTRDTLWSS